jgi:tetratricopeptide (TPR) repeat protein
LGFSLCGFARATRRRLHSLVILQSFALFAVASNAQTEGATTDVPTPSAPEQAPPDPKLERARKIVAAAEPLFVAGHYSAALAEYSRAYDILAGHPRQYWVLHNLAACNERLFRYEVAIELYAEYLRRAPATEDDRAEVAAIMRTLQSLLVTLAVESAVPGEVWVDDRRIGNAPGRWPVPAGRHIVEFRAALYEAERRDVDMSAGRVTTLRFEPRRLSTYRGPGKGFFWTAVGATGAAAAAGTTLGIMALSARNEGRERAELYLDTTGDARRTRTLALAADTGFSAAIVFGVTATVLYFVTDWGRPAQQARTKLHLEF